MTSARSAGGAVGLTPRRVESIMSSQKPPEDQECPETVDLGSPRVKVARIDWKPGEVVAGRYQIHRKLGSGGMGIVAEADDQFLRKKVAIKALRPDVAANPLHVERFRKEVAMAHTVTHPNIARTYDLGEFNSIHYFSMEYLEGTPLSQRLWQDGTLPLRELKEILVPVCRALDAAHKANIIHRDLKPSNLMLVDPPRRVVVMDFGISGVIGAHEHQEPDQHAKDASAVTEWEVTSVGMGTPQYMSPEQWLGEPTGPPSDIYALGCIVFQCLTGRPPFRGEDKSYYFNAHVTEEPPRLRSIDRNIPKAIDNAVARCLEKDPQERFRTAGDLAQAILGKRSFISWLRFAAWAVVLALIIGLIGWGAIRMAEEAIKVEMRPAVSRLAQLVAQQFSTEMLEPIRIDAPYPSPAYLSIQEALIPVFRGERPAQSPLEQAVHRVFAQFLEAVEDNPEILWIYILRRLDDRTIDEPGVWWEFVVDSDPIPGDFDENGIIEGAEQGAMPGHHYESTEIPAMMRCLESGQPDNDDDFVTDAYGYTLSGYAPIGDVRGPGGYILGIDVDNSRLTAFRQIIMIICGLAWAVLVLLTRVFESRILRRRADSSSGNVEPA